MPLEIYNTLTRKKEVFTPLREGSVGMYVCGPTVYSDAHIGHAKSYITFDVVRRYLTFLGYDLTYVENITDVGHLTDDADEGEDKLIKRGREIRQHPMQIAETYTRRFFEDMSRLNVLPPDIAPRATGHILEQIEMIRVLIDKGFAYTGDGNVYFDITKDAEYGKLSGRKVEEQESSGRVEERTEKRNPQDFALWKKAEKCHILHWPSPWGVGFPGWHIECSAMSTKYLGQPFDIHGGGRDLIFPHHENEIAQSEGASGQPLARYWLHNGFLNIDQEKMSKSLGNIFTIREILAEYDAAALRHYFLSSHYRSPMDFSKEGLEEAGRATDRIHETVERVGRAVRSDAEADGALMESFRQEMDDDFNTPRALALIFDEVRALNRLLDEKKPKGLEARAAALRTMCTTLGLLSDGYLERKKQRWLSKAGITREKIEEQIARREQARKTKSWSEADRIRNELQAMGVVIEDTPEGAVWKVK